MSDLIFHGVDAAAEQAEAAVQRLLCRCGADSLPEFSDAIYRCPALRVLTDTELRRAGDIAAGAAALRSGQPELQQTPGLLAWLYAELRELALAGLHHGETGILPDAVIRSLGVPLLTGDIPGIVIFMGSAECAAHVSFLAQSYREKGLTVFLTGAAVLAGLCAAEDSGLICFGSKAEDAICALSTIVRIAMIFCGTGPGSGVTALQQALTRIPVMINYFGAPDEINAAVLAGAAELGIPVISDSAFTGLQLPETLYAAAVPEQMAALSLKMRGVKLKPRPLILPVAYDSAFEGERVRGPECAAEFLYGCELVTAAAPEDVEDHGFAVIGPELPVADGTQRGGYLAISVLVSGQRMQKDFEPVIERRIHAWLNYASGVEHQGMRDGMHLRIRRSALAAGLRLADLAEMIYHGLRTEFAPVADQCQIRMITEPAAWSEFRDSVALPRFQERDQRLAALTDEGVDTFYSCTMCQSIAPNHCCVVTPERCGMCGAVTWPDARAAFELDPNGPNRPIRKGVAQDEQYGCYDAVDLAVNKATNGTVSHLSLYSLIEAPMTGCGRLECICCVEPLSGGVILVDRDYSGMTPVGMPFEDLASMVFGGVQNPGFMGVGRQYISSEKFLRADGGALRIVWMSRELKERVSAALDRTAEKLYGIRGLCDRIADETVTTDPETLYTFLTEREHPVLEMAPMM